MQDKRNLKSTQALKEKKTKISLPEVLLLIIILPMLIRHSRDVDVNNFLCTIIVFISFILN